MNGREELPQIDQRESDRASAALGMTLLLAFFTFGFWLGAGFATLVF
ncbi:hypothetical protein [Ancylobacter pratisalsi]|uniref:Uncharacterized protein n=1 Tax=Ancylobacter pratisalsi TaxID=1745854 RepID=A0A6P1YSX1_9HYPH|nr:hypothetical protein [Ancylobacter pratisalsi]QIB34784.1 hypothetical protein G3A50_14500 [Ancylobacter pratisalsi]